MPQADIHGNLPSLIAMLNPEIGNQGPKINVGVDIRGPKVPGIDISGPKIGGDLNIHGPKIDAGIGLPGVDVHGPKID